MSRPRSELVDLLFRLDADLREFFEERAAIREFDGGLPREEAELWALLDILHREPLAFAGCRLLRVERDGVATYALTVDSESAQAQLAASGFRVIGAVDLRDTLTQLGGLVFLAPPR